MTYLVNFDRFELLKFLPKKGKVAEIGVKRGKYAHKIFNINKPEKLHLIDPWGIDEDDSYMIVARENSLDMQSYYERVLETFSSQIDSGEVQIHRNYSCHAVTSFPDLYFDWVYVDANHLYGPVLNDLISLGPKVKEDGFIVGHDFVNSAKTSKEGYGVTEAVYSFLKLNPDFSLVLLTNEVHGSFVISKHPGGENEAYFLNKVFASANYLIKTGDLFSLNYKQIELDFYDPETNEKVIKIIIQSG